MTAGDPRAAEAAEAASAARPVFVVGCPRSGTGLLRDLLRSHPSLAFPDESHFIPALWRAYGDPSSDAEAVALAERILALRWVQRWQLGREPEAFAHHRSYAAMVDDLYSTVVARDGATRWGDKTPQYVLAIPLLHELFPQARFVHIIRDGRDVTRSILRLPFGPQNVYAAAAYWRRLVRTGRHHGAARADAYTEVRYEELLDDPEAALRPVLELLGEPWTDTVLRPTGRKPIEPGRARSWRDEMADGDRRLVESVAGDLLTELGYELAEPQRPLGAARRAAARADDKARLALLRLRTRDPDFWRTEVRMRVAALRARARR